MKHTVVDISLPRGWHELSAKQMQFLFRLIAEGRELDELRSLCVLKWGRLKVVGRYGCGDFMMRRRRRHGTFVISAEAFAAVFNVLDWIGELPNRAFPLPDFHRHKALQCDFQSVPFETYIVCENLYQGYLHTHNEELLDELGGVLYNMRPCRLNAPVRAMLLYYFAALKNDFSTRWPHFLQPASAVAAGGNLLGPTSPQSVLQDSMNAQIRALTKGDVTKEREVLALDTWRAMTELDALARDYQEFQAKYGKK